MIFVLTSVVYIVYDRKNENHWSLLNTRYSLLGIQTLGKIFNVCVSKRGNRALKCSGTLDI